MAICGKLLITRSSGLALKITGPGTRYEVQERKCVVAVEIMRDILAGSAVINFALPRKVSGVFASRQGHPCHVTDDWFRAGVSASNRYDLQDKR